MHNTIDTQIGQHMHDLVCKLFPICRSLTGDGVRQTLTILQKEIPELTIHEVASGTPCFDWSIPDEWNITDGYILDPNGVKIVDFRQSNLHVMGYSTPINKKISLEELEKHLHSIQELPEAIPYLTSYYKRDWGFCISHSQRQTLQPGEYQVVIDARLGPGHMSYGEVVLPGISNQEVLISTYVCHPSMANNELSGPVVTSQLVRWLSSLANREYTYRVLFIPETIGSIYYISQHLDHLRKNVIAGFNVTCVGDDRVYSYLPSRNGKTFADRIAQHVLKHHCEEFIHYSFLDRGSDERQYCSPGVDLPMVSIMRSKYHTYPEYHNSMDDLNLVTPEGLSGSYMALVRAILCVEHNATYTSTVLCEPMLGRRNLYPSQGGRVLPEKFRYIKHILAYSDGQHDLLSIAEIIGIPMWELLDIVEQLTSQNLISPGETEHQTAHNQTAV
ncbi:MAG: DUF4910 domain-containing protein [Magnetococcales bacterium]|nr:DUF4910 domain-containing protein [Magnetococcales bacterium]